MYALMPEPLLVKDPYKKFIRQTIVIGSALLIVTSIVPSHILETGFSAEYYENETDFIEEGDELPLPPIFMNEEGFVLKSSPVSEDVSRIGFTDLVKHTVVAGDSLSSIASLYGISVKTLVWENNVAESAPLKIGSVLSIPPLDGVSHTVSGKTETLSSIAKLFNVDVKLIRDHNKIEGDAIAKGQKLFIPGGKRKDPVIVVRSGTRSSGRAVNTFDSKIVMSSDAEPADGVSLIFPTNGKVTQGFRRGHYAIDVGNSAKPDIWASDHGNVVLASGGCLPRSVKIDRSCGHGYGNYVILDHGDGLQTLYAHMETVYVSEGQKVERGQALGKMGSSGRTYGATGIHLHFEVFDHGVKKNPSKYF